MGPGRHSASYGQSFSPNGPIWGPFRPLFDFPIFPIFPLGPNSSKSMIPNEVLGPWGPGWGERAAPGGRRPTFRRGVGGAEPPHCNAGGVGGRQPPHRKGTLGAIADSEIWNPVWHCVRDSWPQNLVIQSSHVRHPVGDCCRVLLHAYSGGSSNIFGNLFGGAGNLQGSRFRYCK